MNNVFLVGHLGGELKCFNPDDKNQVFGVSIATNSSYKNQAGEKIDVTEWHDLILFGKQGEFFKDKLSKGQKVAVNGKLVYKKYLNKAGQESRTAQINVDNLEFFNVK